MTCVILFFFLRDRYWSKGCALLSCLLGLTWILGVFVVNQDTIFMAYLFNIFNTLQVRIKVFLKLINNAPPTCFSIFWIRYFLDNLIKIREQTRFNLRSCKELLLEPSMVKTKKTLGDKSFQVAAPGLWNKLPSEIRAIRSYADHFKRAIKTYLFKKAFVCYS